MEKQQDLKSENYNSDDDIEKQQIIKTSEEDSAYLLGNRRDNNKKPKFIINKRINSLPYLRWLNILSILFLISTFIITSFFRSFRPNSYLILENLQRKSISAESNLLVLYIACFMILISLVITLARHLFIDKNRDYNDIDKIITIHFRHCYSIANALFAISLLVNSARVFEQYCINVATCLGSLVFYFIAYYRHNQKIENIDYSKFFNQIAFKINLSLLLGWSVCFLTITIANFLSFWGFSLRVLSLCSNALHLGLTCFVIIVLSYYKDVCFAFILLIFQVGNTLNVDFLSIASDLNYSLVLTVISACCVAYTVIFGSKQDGLEDE